MYACLPMCAYSTVLTCTRVGAFFLSLCPCLSLCLPLPLFLPLFLPLPLPLPQALCLHLPRTLCFSIALCPPRLLYPHWMCELDDAAAFACLRPVSPRCTHLAR